MDELLIDRRSVLRAFRKLRSLLRTHSIKHLNRQTGVSRTTLTRIRDGASSPTFAMYDKIIKVVIADAALDARRAREPNSSARMND